MSLYWNRKRINEHFGWSRGSRNQVDYYIEKKGFPTPVNLSQADKGQKKWLVDEVLLWEWSLFTREYPEKLLYLKRRHDAIRKAEGLDDVA